jgi:hypothetical protein
MQKEKYAMEGASADNAADRTIMWQALPAYAQAQSALRTSMVLKRNEFARASLT